MAIFEEDKPIPANNGITLEDAIRVIDAAKAKAGEIGVMMNIAVVDAGGNLTAFAKDGWCMAG